MKTLFILTIVFSTWSLTSKAQHFIGATESSIADSMKKQDIFDEGIQRGIDRGVIMTYSNFMHKDGTPKKGKGLQLKSAQFILKDNKCEVEIYLYDNAILNEFLAGFNTNTLKYKAINGYEWVDIKNEIAIKIILSSEQKVFLIQYKLIK